MQLLPIATYTELDNSALECCRYRSERRWRRDHAICIDLRRNVDRRYVRVVDDAVPSIATTIRQIFNRQILFEAVCIRCITDGMRPRIRSADLHSAREPVIPVHEHGVVRSDSTDVLQRDVPKARIETSRAKY